MQEDKLVWPASSRYAPVEQIAPGALGFVEDFLNTTSLGKPRQPDLLGSLETAREWLASTSSALAEVTEASILGPEALDDRGLEQLITFRDTLREALVRSPNDVARDLPSLESSVSVRFAASGAILTPRGSGVESLRSFVMLQLAAASYSGVLGRLKVCENPRCRGAFYDRSKNSSRVWHDVSTCGNAANLRSYRARILAREQLSV